MQLTPEQRHDLVTRASDARLALGLEIAHVSVQPWLMDRDRLVKLYNDLCDIDRTICAEFDWPGGKREEM